MGVGVGSEPVVQPGLLGTCAAALPMWIHSAVSHKALLSTEQRGDIGGGIHSF